MQRSEGRRRRGRPPGAGTLSQLGEDIIRQALDEKETALASLTLERTAKIIGRWPTEPAKSARPGAAGAKAVEPPEPTEVLVYTSEPLTMDQWAERVRGE